MGKRYTLDGAQCGYGGLYHICDNGILTAALGTRVVIDNIHDDCEIMGGVFYDGIFKGGQFWGGSFYGGVFSSGEFRAGEYYFDGEFILGDVELFGRLRGISHIYGGSYTGLAHTGAGSTLERFQSESNMIATYKYIW